MADELTNSRAGLQRQNRDAQSAIQDLLSEREQFRQEMIATQKYGTHYILNSSFSCNFCYCDNCLLSLHLITYETYFK